MRDLRHDLALRIAPVVLKNITTRFPYHDGHLFLDNHDSFDPAVVHPAFSNSFDWHSSVHSHWTAVQLIEYLAGAHEGSPIAARLREVVIGNLTAENVAAEAAYFAERPTYERPYGWAWTLMLAAGVHSASTLELKILKPQMIAIAEQIAAAAVRWLDELPIPVRHGVHSNTAFALGLMADAARVLSFASLSRAVESRARAWFGEDRDYAHAWERSGNDFLSPGLAEADLMRRLLPREAFRAWWAGFMPNVADDAAILTVAHVPAVRDGQIVHLHGLNLSRAAALARIAEALSLKRELACAERLYLSGVDAAAGDDYLSTHWLATFAWDAARSIDVAGASIA